MVSDSKADDNLSANSLSIWEYDIRIFIGSPFSKSHYNLFIIPLNTDFFNFYYVKAESAFRQRRRFWL